MDNVYIGSGTKIMHDVKIGSNVIVAAGSIVTRDVPDNSVVAGVPARVIGSFDDYVNKRMTEERYPKEIKPAHQEVGDELAGWCWEQFNRKRSEKTQT